MENKLGLDYAGMNISRLYVKILIPTLLGMISTILVTIVDGYFVGRYAGSDALAAVNIASPVFMLGAGFGLMFGVGCSIVSAIYLSKNKLKAANVNFTQAVLTANIFVFILSLFILVNVEEIARLFGSTDVLQDMVVTYIAILAPSLTFFMMMSIGMFVIRLDGSPKYAMFCSMVPAILNIIADFILVGCYGMGVKGAVLATSGSFVVGGCMAIAYFVFFSNKMKFCRLSLSCKGLVYAFKNIYAMCSLGFSAFVSELAIALMILVGNYVFLKYLGEDGVAAYGVICYYFPIFFMINNSFAQASQPIISYNYGIAAYGRISVVFNLSLKLALLTGIILTVVFAFIPEFFVSVFLDSTYESYRLAVNGFPYFALGFTFLALNIVAVGYFQSIRKIFESNLLTFLRGYVFLIAFFITLPMLLGINGIWLAIPFAELCTCMVFGIMVLRKRHRLS